MKEQSNEVTVEELKDEVEDLRTLVHTLLTIIMEEADGVQSGATPQIPNQPKRGYCMSAANQFAGPMDPLVFDGFGVNHSPHIP